MSPKLGKHRFLQQKLFKKLYIAVKRQTLSDWKRNYLKICKAVEIGRSDNKKVEPNKAFPHDEELELNLFCLFLLKRKIPNI